jgi:hypothetical protein
MEHKELDDSSSLRRIHDWAQQKNDSGKILVFLDNCPAHPHTLSFSNIKCLFFPANTTSVLQPMDQGIIKCFKSYYRKRLLRYLINSFEANPDTSLKDVSVNLRSAMIWTLAAWDEVTRSTIVNCFNRAGFNVTEAMPTETEDIPVNQEITESLLQELSLKTGTELSSLDEYVLADDVIVTDCPNNDYDDEDTEEEEDTIEAEEEVRKPTTKEMMSAIETIASYGVFVPLPEKTTSVLGEASLH